MTACLDWETRIRNGKSLIPAPMWPDEARAANDIMGELRIVDAIGSPKMRDACAQWVFDFAGAIFGAYEAETGRRHISEAFLCIPKKNSKSTIAAAIMLTALIRNWRESAEYIILAPTVEVAGNSFAPARDMIRKDPELSKMLLVQEHIRTITHRVTKATLKVVAADAATVGGKKAVGVLIDEAWLFGKVANASDMIREATGGLASRPEGFVIWLTTQSNEPPAGVFASKLRYARDVRDGKVNAPHFLPVIYEFPKAMIDAKEHLNLANAPMVNPNWGYSVDPVFMRQKFDEAKAGTEQEMREFLAKHLNVEIGLALRSDRWAGADFWQLCATPEPLTLDVIIERSSVLCVGIDGGGLDDLLGLAVIGRDDETRQWLLWTHAWAHTSVLERRKSESPKLRDFESDGDLTIVERMGDDVQQVADIVSQCEISGKLDKIGCDPAGIGAILDALAEAEIPDGKAVAVGQGWRLNGSIKTMERKLAEGVIRHGGSRLMAWSVGNARIEPKGNAILITKQASGTAKIDPLMAALNACHLMSLNPESAAITQGFVEL